MKLFLITIPYTLHYFPNRCFVQYVSSKLVKDLVGDLN